MMNKHKLTPQYQFVLGVDEVRYTIFADTFEQAKLKFFTIFGGEKGFLDTYHGTNESAPMLLSIISVSEIF